MALSRDGGRLFVACASTNAVWVIDAATSKATEQISISLFPQAPPGSTPNALAILPAGERLLVATPTTTRLRWSTSARWARAV